MLGGGVVVPCGGGGSLPSVFWPPTGGPAHGQHPRFVVAEIWANWAIFPRVRHPDPCLRVTEPSAHTHTDHESDRHYYKGANWQDKQPSSTGRPGATPGACCFGGCCMISPGSWGHPLPLRRLVDAPETACQFCAADLRVTSGSCDMAVDPCDCVSLAAALGLGSPAWQATGIRDRQPCTARRAGAAQPQIDTPLSVLKQCCPARLPITLPM